jgi:Tol biopolymer transport system component
MEETTRARKAWTYPALLAALVSLGYGSQPDKARAETALLKEPAAAMPSKTPERLVFVSNRSGNYQIYLKNLVTKRLVNLSRSDSNDMNAQPSPDGKKLVFYSDRTGNNQIYQLNIDQPGKVKRITHDNAQDYDPVYMPDGHIAYKSDKREPGLGDIMIMGANGSNTRNLTTGMTNLENWKPEPISGSELLYTSSQGSARANPGSNEIYKINVNTGDKEQLTNNDVPDWFPSYNAVIKKIAFTSKDSEKGSDAIYTMDLNGMHRAQVSHLPGDSDDPSWSPDGKQIVFLNNVAGNYNVEVVNSNGRGVSTLDVSPAGDDLSPIFIP